MTYIPLSYFDLALSAALLVVNGALSLAYGLRIEKTLAISAVRMIVQLTAVALVLKFIFAQTSPWWTLLFIAVMAAAATVQRSVLPEFSQGSTHTGWCWWLGSSALSRSELV